MSNPIKQVRDLITEVADDPLTDGLYQPSIDKLQQAVTLLTQLETQRKAAIPYDPASDFGRFKDAALKYYEGWEKHDLDRVLACEDEFEVYDMINELAGELGENKGWGIEGIGQEQSDMLDAIIEASGLDDEFKENLIDG